MNLNLLQTRLSSYLDLTLGNDGTDSIYYTAWDHAIYDDVVLDKASGKRVKDIRDKAGGNVTVDYTTRYPSRPKPKHPHVNNVKPKTGITLTFSLKCFLLMG